MIKQFLMALAGSIALANITLSILFLEVKKIAFKKSLPSPRDRLFRQGIFILFFWFLISPLQVNALLIAILLPISYTLSLYFYTKFLFREMS